MMINRCTEISQIHIYSRNKFFFPCFNHPNRLNVFLVHFDITAFTNQFFLCCIGRSQQHLGTLAEGGHLRQTWIGKWSIGIRNVGNHVGFPGVCCVFVFFSWSWMMKRRSWLLLKKLFLTLYCLPLEWYQEYSTIWYMFIKKLFHFQNDAQIWSNEL